MRAAILNALVVMALAGLAVSVGAFAILDKRHPAAVTWAWAGIVCVLVGLIILVFRGNKEE